ncbi:MAG TPA: hypothetical protein VLR46_08350 [Candidatus Dormibacteraeota bacterium]|nr:hypothetical protein [Candidatus Dormibacteraeota bacterium]
MNEFDRQLESDLKRLLDRVVRTPAPPRGRRPGDRPMLRLYTRPGAVIGPPSTVVILVDSSGEAEAAFPAVPAIHGPAFLS